MGPFCLRAELGYQKIGEVPTPTPKAASREKLFTLLTTFFVFSRFFREVA